MRVQIQILRCPVHRHFWAVAVRDRRVTSSKCCGSWDVVQSFECDASEVRAALQGAR